MKKIYCFLLILMSFHGLIISQTVPKFKLTKEGMKPVVLTFDTSHKANIIYTRIKEWISANNQSPQAVTKIDKENSVVKFSCFKEKGWKLFNNNIEYWNDLAYTFTVEIKDAKCRVTFATDEVRYKVWYNKDGSLIKKFKDSEATFETTVNETLTSLYNHLKGAKKKNTDDW